MKPDQKLTYELIVFRKDKGPVLVDNFSVESEAIKIAQDMTNAWSNCLKESKPFVLKKPYYMSFDPGLIMEILVFPSTVNTDASNPYKQQMVREGFSNTLKSTTTNSSNYVEMLDSGYKRE